MNKLEDREVNRGVLAWFVQNQYAANFLMILLILGGLLTIKSIPIKLFPTDLPFGISISTSYPNATPEDVEERVNRRIEEVISNIPEVQSFDSRAVEGKGELSLSIKDSADFNKVLQRVQAAVGKITTLPNGALSPVVVAIKDIPPVLKIAMYGDVSEQSLRAFTHSVRDDIVSLSGITSVNVEGARDYELTIDFDESDMIAYGLTFDFVEDAIKKSSLNLSGGKIHYKNRDVQLRIDGQASTKLEFERIVLITNNNGVRILLGDIATLNYRFVGEKEITLYNGKPAMFIDVLRVGEEQTLKIERGVKDYFSSIALPAGIQSDIVFNDADDLRSSMNLLFRNAIMGLMLVFTCLAIFLNFRLAFWTSIGISVSFLGSIFLMKLSGQSINMISIFAFIMVLGIVVDDAIIIGESIYTKYQSEVPAMDASIAGLYDVIKPVTANVLTTIAAFTPLLFVTGYLSPVTGTIAFVVMVVLIVSLAEAALILPSHLSSSNSTKSKERDSNRVQLFLNKGLEKTIDNNYMPILRYAVRQPYVVIAMVLSLLTITTGVINGGKLLFTEFPEIDSNIITVEFYLPKNSVTDDTEKYVKRILELTESARKNISEKYQDGVEDPFRSILVSANNRSGIIDVHLLEAKLRTFSSLQAEAIWRQSIGNINELSFVFESSDQSTQESDIEVLLSHPERDQLLLATKFMKNELKKFQGVQDVRDSFENGREQLSLKLTEFGIASGLTLNDLIKQVGQSLDGKEIQRFHQDRDEVKVFVRQSKLTEKEESDIYSMHIRLASGKELPISMVAILENNKRHETITRVNGGNVVRINAKVDENNGNAFNINKTINSDVIPQLIKNFPGLTSNVRDGEESLTHLKNAFIFSLVVVFGILSIQLRSYVQPLIIMSVIPLGFVGAAAGHLLLGYNLSILSLFGLVAMSGIVVNDSLILVDSMNNFRRSGMQITDAIFSACRKRFRPVLLTTMTTCVGLSPLILEQSLQAELVIPMAIGIVFGVAFSTLITLFFTPALYIVIFDISTWVKEKIYFSKAAQ